VLLRATPRNELVSATAWLTIPGLIGPLTGPVIGGFFTTYLSWHWIFWINVPIGLVGIVLATKFLPPPEPRTPRPIDLPGFLLLAIAFPGVIFGLSVISLPAIPVVAGYAAIAIGLAAALIYYRRTRRVEFPLLDPRLFHHRYFRVAMLGGIFFRIGIGAFPFLMPLMLQLSFGFTPFESGLTTFVSAIGAIISKFAAERFYARFGFPRMLTATSIFGCAFLAVNGFITPETPHLLLMLFLFIGGLTRSIFFTGINVFGYADIDETEASQATAIAAVTQQLAVALGVAVGGGILEFMARTHGGGPTLMDFHIAWFGVAILSAVSIAFFLRLPPDAGSHMSGHKPVPLPPKPDGAA